MKKLDEAQRIAPRYALIYQYRSNVAYLMGDRAAAVEALRKGLELEPDNALFQENLKNLQNMPAQPRAALRVRGRRFPRPGAHDPSIHMVADRSELTVPPAAAMPPRGEGEANPGSPPRGAGGEPVTERALDGTPREILAPKPGSVRRRGQVRSAGRTASPRPR